MKHSKSFQFANHQLYPNLLQILDDLEETKEEANSKNAKLKREATNHGLTDVKKTKKTELMGKGSLAWTSNHNILAITSLTRLSVIKQVWLLPM